LRSRWIRRCRCASRDGIGGAKQLRFSSLFVTRFATRFFLFGDNVIQGDIVMKTKQYVFACIMCALAITSCVSTKETYGRAGSDNKTLIYQLTWDGNNVKGSLFVNEFLIAGLSGAQGFGTAPLNVLLVGDNEVRVELKKADTSKASHFKFGVSQFIHGDVAATTDRGNLLSVEKKDNDFSGSKNVKISRKFTSSLNFNSRFIGTETVKEKEVIDYAKKIYGLVKKKDAAGLEKEFAVKIEDYTKAFPVHTYGEFKSSLLSELLEGSLEKVNPGRLRAKKTGPGGNTWHVVEGDKELIRKKSSGSSSISEMTIYIGVVNGALKVIR